MSSARRPKISSPELSLGFEVTSFKLANLFHNSSQKLQKKNFTLYRSYFQVADIFCSFVGFRVVILPNISVKYTLKVSIFVFSYLLNARSKFHITYNGSLVLRLYFKLHFSCSKKVPHSFSYQSSQNQFQRTDDVVPFSHSSAVVNKATLLYTWINFNFLQ